ncbi:MAG: glycosyltransferase family protein [Ignavibacteriaceae bacterium]|jgi:spore coat polysaccharide biosynthesis protein SpsF|nr:glycosyltransferase family protein [Ignavibacteriaceae bacterium]
MNKVVIVQARLGSTRLPSKVLKDLSGKPVLYHVLERIRNAKLVDNIVIATTDLDSDEPLVEYLRENKINYYRGSSEDVLSRYYETALQYKADIIIRITSDCPLIDPIVIDEIINIYLENNNYDYVSNTLMRSFPRGLDVELFTFDSLKKSFLKAEQKWEREHVTPYIYTNRDLFNVYNFANKTDQSFFRWTLDTPEDYQLIKEIYDSLYNEGKIFTTEEVISLFRNRPELIDINKHIEQKKL